MSIFVCSNCWKLFDECSCDNPRRIVASTEFKQLLAATKPIEESLNEMQDAILRVGYMIAQIMVPVIDALNALCESEEFKAFMVEYEQGKRSIAKREEAIDE